MEGGIVTVRLRTSKRESRFGAVTGGRVGASDTIQARVTPPRPEPDPMPTPDEMYDEAVDLRDKGDKAAAIARLEEAVAIDRDFAIGHGMLAKLYADLAEADKAIAHARRVVEIE